MVYFLGIRSLQYFGTFAEHQGIGYCDRLHFLLVYCLDFHGHLSRICLLLAFIWCRADYPWQKRYHHKKGVLGRKKTFRYDHIDRIRLLDASTGVFPLNPYGGHITLTCAGIQFIFAKHVNHHEAAYIHEKLLSHLNQ